MDLPIATASGKVLDLATLSTQDIKAWDIAWALAQINRYNGATLVPWSVLSHTALGFQILGAVAKDASPATKLAWLLHDGHEAYTGDMNGYILAHDNMQWLRTLQRLVQQSIDAAFGLLGGPNAADADLLDKIDTHCRYVEMRTFFPECSQWWEGFHRFEIPYAGLTPVARAEEFVQILQSFAPEALPSVWEFPARLSLYNTGAIEDGPPVKERPAPESEILDKRLGR